MQGKDFNGKLPRISDHCNSWPPGTSSAVSFSQARVKDTFLHPGARPLHTHTHAHTHTQTGDSGNSFSVCGSALAVF